MRVKHLAQHRGIDDPNMTGKCIVSVPVDTFKVAKEIATMILAIEPLKFGDHLTDLRRFVLNAQAPYVSPFKVFGVLVPFDPSAGTIAPSHGRVDTFAPGLGMHGGEISRWPFGLVYAWELGSGYNPASFADITGWFWGEKPPFVSLPTALTGIDAFQCLLGPSRNCPQTERF